MNKYYEAIRFSHLLAKFVMQDIKDEEKSELKNLIEKSEINISELIHDIPALYSDTIDDTQQIEAGKRVLRYVENRIRQSKRRLIRRIIGYAAISVGLFILSFSAYYLNSQDTVPKYENISLLENEIIFESPAGEKAIATDITDVQELLRESALSKIKNSIITPQMCKIKVSKGTTHTVRLADGTTVTLFPESELHFPSFFTSEKRLVTLVGEGYFEVQRDESKPFIVSTDSALIAVLGTTFNVRAYRGEDNVKTVLLSGKVMMNETTLQPNQMATLCRKNKQVVVEDVDAMAYRERANGMFVFDNKTLKEIMNEFCLWYGFNYHFDDISMENKRFRFKLPRANSIDKLLELMEKTGEIEFEVAGNHIKVTQK